MKTILATFTIVATTLLSACLGQGISCTSSGPEDFEGQELRVLDHGAWNSAYEWAKPAFEAQTGAKLVQIQGEDAGAALRQAIESRGNPVADVIYGIDNALIHEAARADILEPYESPRTSAIDTAVIHLDDFRTEGVLLATPVDHGYVSVNYDRQLEEGSDDDVPTTLRELAEPAWASKFAVEDPRLSSPGLGFLIATVATFGESGNYTYLNYWYELLDGGVLVAQDWTEAYVVHFSAGYGRYEENFAGDRTLVVSYTTSPAAEAFFGDGTPPSVSLEPAKSVFHQVETVAILRCTDQLPLAKAFVDFVLGSDYQNQTAATMAVYPVVRGATVPAAFQNATAPGDLEPAPFSSEELASSIDGWLDAWTELYQTNRA